MAGVTNREFWDFRVKTRAQFTKLAEQIANIDTSGGGGISELTSKMVVDALGYTPYNANNPANYITASALTPYALKTDIPSLAGYATEDFVNNQLEDYATKDYVTTKLVNYAPLTSVQGFENRIGGLESAVPQLNNRVTTVEGKVSSLNETVSTGENNLLDRVNVIEEEYATKTYVDNAIGGIDLSPYLKTEDAEGTYATKDFVNNKLINYATIVSVTAIQNTLTGQIGAVDARVEQLAATKFDSANFTKANLKSTLGISDWALAATKPSYAWSEITSRPTALSQFTDDVVAGKYLPLSGGTIRNDSNAVPLTIASSAQAYTGMSFINKNNERGYFIYAGGSDYSVTAAGWSATYTLMHSGNIGNYKSGDSAKLGGKSKDYYIGQNIDVSQVIDLNTIERNHIIHGNKWNHNLSGTIASVLDISYSADWRSQLLFNSNTKKIYSRFFVEGYLWSDWQQIAFITDNVASATKLATAHTLWGQSFDGTKDITLGLNLDGYKSTGTVSQISDLGDKGLVVSVDDKRNNYGMAFWVEGSCKGYIQQQAFGSSTTYSLCIQPFGGNVGIGTTSPAERLDVSGNIKASGNINATSITINGVTITASNGSITVNGNVLATGDITGGV